MGVVICLILQKLFLIKKKIDSVNTQKLNGKNCRRCTQASFALSTADSKLKDDALLLIAEKIINQKNYIQSENRLM